MAWISSRIHIKEWDECFIILGSVTACPELVKDMSCYGIYFWSWNTGMLGTDMYRKQDIFQLAAKFVDTRPFNNYYVTYLSVYHCDGNSADNYIKEYFVNANIKIVKGIILFANLSISWQPSHIVQSLQQHSSPSNGRQCGMAYNSMTVTS